MLKATNFQAQLFLPVVIGSLFLAAFVITRLVPDLNSLLLIFVGNGISLF